MNAIDNAVAAATRSAGIREAKARIRDQEPLAALRSAFHAVTTAAMLQPNAEIGTRLGAIRP